MKPLIGARLPRDENTARMVEAAKRVGVPPWKMISISRSNETRILFPVLPLEDDDE